MAEYFLCYTDKAEKDLAIIAKSDHVFKKVQKLLGAIAIDPRSGIGKPERLKRAL